MLIDIDVSSMNYLLKSLKIFYVIFICLGELMECVY